MPFINFLKYIFIFNLLLVMLCLMGFWGFGVLPIVDKPLIQYAVQEAISAGAEELIFITGRSKNSIMDHFDKAYELEAELASRGKNKLLETVQEILPPGHHLHLHPPGRSPRPGPRRAVRLAGGG